MEALDKGLDRLMENDHDMERLEWEKEVEQKKLELENKRLEFEMKRMEAEERRSRDNREMFLQMVQLLRPPPQFPSYMGPSHFPFMPPRQGPPGEFMDPHHFMPSNLVPPRHGPSSEADHFPVFPTHRSPPHQGHSSEAINMDFQSMVPGPSGPAAHPVHYLHDSTE